MTIFPVHPSNFPYIFGVFRLFSVFLTLPLLCHSFYTFTVSITLPDPFCFLLVRFHPIPRIFPCEDCLLKGTGELLIPIIQYCAVKNNFSFSLSSHSVTIQLYRYRSHLSLSIAYFVFTRKFALKRTCISLSYHLL